MRTTPTQKLLWTLEDAGRFGARMLRQAFLMGLTLLVGYSLAPPLWDTIFAPSMAAAYELPYTAANRMDRALSLTGFSGVMLKRQSCGQVSQWVRSALPPVTSASVIQRVSHQVTELPRKKTRSGVKQGAQRSVS